MALISVVRFKTDSATDPGAGPINTHGAKLIVFQTGSQLGAFPTAVDSEGNTWGAELGTVPVSSGGALRTRYARLPATSAAHTFSLSGGTFVNAIVAAFDDLPFTGIPNQTGEADGASPVSTPILKPNQNGAIVLAGGVGVTGVDWSVDSPWEIAGQLNSDLATQYDNVLAYRIQEMSEALSATFTLGGGIPAGAVFIGVLPFETPTQHRDPFRANIGWA